MTKKIAHNFIPALLLLTVFGVTTIPSRVAHADVDCSKVTQQSSVADQTACANKHGIPTTAAGAAALVAKTVGGGIFDLVGTVLFPLVTVVLTLTSFITMLGGVALNASIYLTVTQMAQNFSHLSAIDTAWGVIRDVANMGFIFVLLYTAIMTIFGEGNYRETIVRTVIAAILINFSLFFTKVIIDIANLLALTLYNAIAPGASADFLKAGLSNSFMDPMGFATLWKLSGSSIINPSNFTVVGILGSVVLLIAAFIFFAIALMFVIRYVVLILVLILSPIAFVASVLPGLKKQSGQWWDALLHQAFFAPIYFLLTWVAITVINGITSGSNPNWAAALGGATQAANGTVTANFSPSLIMTVLNFAIIIAFLIATLVISKSFAEKAGGAIKKLTGSALGFAGGTVFGGTARLSRNIIGSRAANMANDEDLKRRASEGSVRARLQLATANRMSKASFDLRATPVGGPLEAGKARTGGFVQDQKDRAKEYEKYKPSGGAKKKAEDATKAADEALKKVQEDAAKDAETKVPKTPELVKAEQDLETAKKASYASGPKTQTQLDAEKDLTAAEQEAYTPDPATGYDPTAAAAFEANKKTKVEAAKQKVEQENIQYTANEAMAKTTFDTTKKTNIDAAQSKLEEEKKKHDQAVQDYIKNRTTSEEQIYNDASAAEKAMTDRMTNMANRIGDEFAQFSIFSPEDILLPSKSKADAIRAAAKEKSKREKAMEANLELAQEEEEEKKKSAGGGPAAPAAPAPSSTPPASPKP